MPEYSAAAIALVAVTLALAWRRRLLARRSTWLGLAAFGAATIVADVVLTGLPIVTYDPAHLAGIALGPMPMEDLLYGLALFLVAVLAWDAAGPGAPSDAGRGANGTRPDEPVTAPATRARGDGPTG